MARLPTVGIAFRVDLILPAAALILTFLAWLWLWSSFLLPGEHLLRRLSEEGIKLTRITFSGQQRELILSDEGLLEDFNARVQASEFGDGTGIFYELKCDFANRRTWEGTCLVDSLGMSIFPQRELLSEPWTASRWLPWDQLQSAEWGRIRQALLADQPDSP